MKRFVMAGLALGCVVLAATAIGFASSAYRAQAELARVRASVGVAGDDASGAVSVPLLKKLLSEREAAYFALQNELDHLKQSSSATETSGSPVAAVSTNATAAGIRGGGMAWLERLRTEDPERYKQIQADREQRQQRVAEALNQQLTRLDQRLQTATTQTEADLVTQIADTLTHMDDLRQQWQQARDLPADQQNVATMQQLRDDTAATYQKLADLRTQDRTLQLQQLGSQVGQDPATFAQSVQKIITETDTGASRFIGGGRRIGNTGTTTTTTTPATR